jgi:nucleoside-diphosphate-sugar epimerase
MEPFRTTFGDQLISLTFADDIVKLILKLIHDPSIQGGFSYWKSPLRTVKEYILDIVNICGSPIPLEWGAYPYAGHELFTDPSCFPAEIANDSWTDLGDAVQKIVQSQ